MTPKSDFQKACERIGEHFAIETAFYPEDSASDVYHDDGNLHVSQHGLRAVFFLGQDTPRSEQKRLTTKILLRLGLKVTERATP